MSAPSETPLSRAKGYGSSHQGAHHWWMQRLTSLALVPLVVWCAFSIALLPTLDITELTAWLSQPLTAILLVALIIAACYHAALGLRVIIEDYIHLQCIKVGAIIGVNFAAVLLSIIAIYAIIKIIS